MNRTLKAIHQKCIDCCYIGTTIKEAKELVTACQATNCPLYDFRLGIDPYKKTYTITEEERERRRGNFK